MSGSTRSAAVLTLRVSRELDNILEREARRRRSSKSALVRTILEETLGAGEQVPDPAKEARRQSLLVSSRKSEKDAMAFVTGAADHRGWR